MSNMIYFRPNCLSDSYPEAPLIRMAMSAEQNGAWYIMTPVEIVAQSKGKDILP